jgi:hypothetical protein
MTEPTQEAGPLRGGDGGEEPEGDCTVPFGKAVIGMTIGTLGRLALATGRSISAPGASILTPWRPLEAVLRSVIWTSRRLRWRPPIGMPGPEKVGFGWLPRCADGDALPISGTLPYGRWP